MVALGLAGGSCSRREPAVSVEALRPVSVRVASVVAEDLPEMTEVTGTIRPFRHAVLAAKVMGAITDLPVALGQRVKSGELLLKIFADESVAQVAQTRAQLNLVRRDLERERELLAKGASTKDAVRSLEDRVTGLEAAVREAEARLGYMEIRAPFDGVVARRLVNAGDFATAGQPLLEIEGTAEFEVEASIPEALIAGLTTGSTLECDLDGITFTGRMREISSTADPATRSVGVKIDVPASARVRSGQFCRIHVPGPMHRTLLVPASTVSLSGQMERVFVLNADKRATLRLVRTGAPHGDRVEILSGLNANEQVVLAPPSTLREGQSLEVQP